LPVSEVVSSAFLQNTAQQIFETEILIVKQNRFLIINTFQVANKIIDEAEF
jgi:hypothetical protein